ncbi:MAG: hypothetical protein M1814_005996 [Vezdaea aestivalis]|nr:MAG: hypothetical protein M1814_005996 [Vezdaea aestivalis]
MSFFGSSGFATTNSQPSRPSIFGSSTAQQPTGSQSLFGTAPAQQPQQASTGLFGTSSPAPTQSQGLFGLTAQQPQQAQQSQQPRGVQDTPAFQQSLAQSSSWQLSNNIPPVPLEKPIAQRIEEVYKKWDPQMSECVFKHYFYNKVQEGQSVYYRPGTGENESEWEEALSKKPGKDFVPVLCVGFHQLGQRVKLQGAVINALNAKLHEIDNSLTTMLQHHDLVVSIRAEEVRRKHAVLAQKCLTLATKTQILRNRGYAMGSDEEELRKKLLVLEQQVMNPAIGGRAEEVWARMVAIRERSNILKAEMDRLGQSATTQDQGTLEPAIVQKAEKILEDYGKQLQHLQIELERISKDFEAWKSDAAASKSATGAR